MSDTELDPVPTLSPLSSLSLELAQDAAALHALAEVVTGHVARAEARPDDPDALASLLERLDEARDLAGRVSGAAFTIGAGAKEKATTPA